MPDQIDGPTPDGTPSDATRGIPRDETAPLPQGYAYPSSTDPGAGVSGTSFTDEAATAEPRRTGLVIGAMATLAALGTGVILAANALSGGGTQPADVLPADTYAYARVDIDPSAGQKVAAVRFLNKIPQLKEFETGDTRKHLWELISQESDDECLATFDYDRDVSPWLGERAGVAVRPGGTADDPNIAVALQVTDEGAAASTLTRLFACETGEQPDLRMKDGYALVTAPGTGDELVAAVDQGSLASRPTFAEDMAALGEQGVVSFWGDLARLTENASDLVPDADQGLDLPSDVKGRAAFALRFDPDYVEYAGVLRGLDVPSGLTAGTGDGSALTRLPDDTMAALHVSGLDEKLDAVWPQLEKQLESLGPAGGGDMLGLVEDQLGISLPEDLEALMGSSLTLALPEQDLGADDPELGIAIVSSRAARAEEVLTTIEDAAGSSLLTKKREGDRLYVATSPEYADRLAAGGRLGDSEAFTAALEDVSGSDLALFVDLDRLEAQYLAEADEQVRPALEAMRAVGLTSRVTGSDALEFSLRIVAN